MEWEKFDKQTILDVHNDMYMYRKLYKGQHSQIFARAKELIQKGEVIDYLENGQKDTDNVRTPYLVYNISRIICDVPALLISRSIGEILTNYKYQEATERANTTKDTEMLEGTRDDSFNEDLVDLQQQLINQIVSNSKLTRKHKSNIIQHQIDGGIVGVPVVKNGNVMIQFKERNVYYPHEDGLGADLVYEIDKKDEHDNDYVHVYTERRETDDKLVATNRLYKRNRMNELTEVEDTNEIYEVTGIEADDLSHTFDGRKRLFIDYWGNNVTFMDPLGVSELEGQEGKQEEVNWTITRASQTFERNGKPRISLTSELWDRLDKLAQERGGEGARIDHRDLEITEMDADGNSIKVHQLDVDKIGDMTYVKDIIRAMLAETQTSESLIEFLGERSGTASAQSGIAKFYDLMYSILKAETLRNEYVEFMQNLFESALWLANRLNDNVIIEKPYIELKDMVPQPKEESDISSMNKYTAGAQSLETTVKELHIDKSDEWIAGEVDRILTESSNDNSLSLASNGRQSLQEFLGNRSTSGEPLNTDGTVREE